jgi:putative copper resistance protein D
MRTIRNTSGAHANEFTAAVVRRFSAVSLASVALLTVTGFVNAWYLVGPVQNLFYDNYGRWLMVKIILFAVTIGFGATNLIRLKPRLELPLPGAAVAMAQLRRNIRAEICLTTLIIIAVAILGVLPPPGH